MMRRNRWQLAIILVIVLIGINNTVYYFMAKRSLENGMRHEMLAVAKQIQLSIEQSRLGGEVFQNQIGRELRAVSIAAEYALDPDIDKVTNDQLAELSNKLDVTHISLFRQNSEKDDIIIEKSSDPKELNRGSKTWDPWYDAFQQLLALKPVSVKWGQTLPQFWTGPFESASTDVDKIYKWGYYYDGSTNYLIDPYISNAMMQQYEDATGVNRLIKRAVEENASLLEITAVNPATFSLGGPVLTKNDVGEWVEHITQQPVIYGKYTYQNDGDVKSVEESYRTGRTVTMNTHANGKHVLKTFIPVQIPKGSSILGKEGESLDRYILTIVSDYQFVQDSLDEQFLNIGLIITVITILCMIAVVIVTSYFRRSKDQIAKHAQLTYVDEMNQLLVSVRAQRHDFLNYVQTIHSLAELGKTAELQAYTKELAGDVQLTNDFINIGNPAIAALIRSKFAQAVERKIQFESSFRGLDNLDLGIKSLDLTRIIGNLIDNAFDEVMKYPEERRLIRLEGVLENGELAFVIRNTCDSPETVLSAQQLFDPGYSTKQKDGGHQGLGLPIVKQIVSMYKGTLQVTSDSEECIIFSVRIPHY
ncbi:signal transduction histidine kinase regulating citrate/malate metabolism [Paenibacillus curdlanolyticus YK9]|uniref:Signal transduction histidine kinase regulating citrate/malate metabolism n=1 Tax=Paenibacillus curdlanolyticus YK9 TaxID=717606 RepID=E0IF93_9BACL|nr:GHKL domain-containing protein [Paenibacillus curdlanolyticus]EFM08869.1 signal transduction histidine kinase regulating citrate/malate metabolism [Paenibacillus curdlanolyticus YK9]